MLNATTAAGFRQDGPRLLLVDDDPVLRTVLTRALSARGFRVAAAHDYASACAQARAEPLAFAVLDLRLPGGNGLRLMKELLGIHPGTRVVILTGYASIATAVEAVRLGACHYLAKPTTADTVVAALRKGGAPVWPGALERQQQPEAVSDRPLTVSRLEWEHIQQVLTANGGNVSETARQLGMHRRTLQRKLQKRPVREDLALETAPASPRRWR